jgi:signal recognition particle receptor subunit beta
MQAHLYDKPVLVFANKQDLPTAATAAEVAVALGLSGHKRNQFNILGCTAKTPAGQRVDQNLNHGIR